VTDSWLQIANQYAFTNPQLFFQDDQIIRTQGSLLLYYRIFFYFLSNRVCVISQTIKLTIAKDHSKISLKLDTDEFKRKSPQAKIFI
jgi:hypothetical protein